jgi:hypothetical protein
MFQSGTLLTKNDYFWLKVVIHVGGKMRGYVFPDIDKELEKTVKRIGVLESSGDKKEEE